MNQIVPASGRHLSSTGYDRSLLLWDLETGESVLRFSGHSSPVASVGLTPGGQRALSGAFDDVMILWDMATGETIRRFPFRRFADGGFNPGISIHPSGQTALTDDIDGSIIQWRLAEPQPVELIDWIAGNRTLRELTCVEREAFRVIASLSTTARETFHCSPSRGRSSGKPALRVRLLNSDDNQ